MKVNQDIMALICKLEYRIGDTHVQIAIRTTDGLMSGALIFGIP